MSQSKILLTIAFVSGMAVTAVEISASRLLAPYFGTSLFVWTNIIGIVLAALSLGYYFGGRLSERRPDLSLLLKIIFAAGWLCLITPWIIRPAALSAMSASGLNGPMFIILGSLFVTAVLFGVPIALLGATSPFLIRLKTLNSPETGQASGSVFAWSTVGSIVGTFVPTLVIIPTLGSKAAIILFSAMLIVLGSFGFGSSLKRLLAAALIVPFLFPSKAPLRPDVRLLEERESPHQYIQVLEDPDGTRYMKINEGWGIQSIYHPDYSTTGIYYDAFTLLPYLIGTERKTDVLIIGLAGGTIARGLHSEFGDRINLEAVEIDPVATELARKYFGLAEVPVKVFHEDGRVFLQTAKKQYDIIIVDAYQNELYIPWTMTTVEFWKLVYGRLTPEGVAAINVNAVSENSRLFLAITNTMARVFPSVHTAKIPDNSINYFITASLREYDFTRLAGSGNESLEIFGQRLAGNANRFVFDPAQPLLTDDLAPIEFYTSEMALDF